MRRAALGARRLFLILIMVAVAGGLWMAQRTTRAGNGPEWLQVVFGTPQPMAGLHVGIVAGHRGNDSGAVCPDGLTEAEINLKVAEAVVESLRGQGIRVDLLGEFDPRLPGYQADAFVSVHADSCLVNFTGFKVAGPEGGSEASDRLAKCIWDEYEAATGLPRHSSTITDNMLQYHSFHSIAADTPAAIIETGFLKADLELLNMHSDIVAAGIFNGIRCFLMPQPVATQPDDSRGDP